MASLLTSCDHVGQPVTRSTIANFPASVLDPPQFSWLYPTAFTERGATPIGVGLNLIKKSPFDIKWRKDNNSFLRINSLRLQCGQENMRPRRKNGNNITRNFWELFISKKKIEKFNEKFTKKRLYIFLTANKISFYISPHNSCPVQLSYPFLGSHSRGVVSLRT